MSVVSGLYSSIIIKTSCPGLYVVESKERDRFKPFTDLEEDELTPLKSVHVFIGATPVVVVLMVKEVEGFNEGASVIDGV